MARPVELQRLQLRTGSLTRTSPFPRHTGHILVSSALPSQNPQGFGEYADIWVIGEVQCEGMEAYSHGAGNTIQDVPPKRQNGLDFLCR